MPYELPEPVNVCIKTLTLAKIECYLVGGCVRDLLLNKVPHDYDIAVNTTPQKIKELFSHTIDTGIKHGTVTVVIHKMPIEITQMRIDGEYVDHRRPKQVIPAMNIYDDLRRRDFTINAIAKSYNNIIDEFGGVNDLNNKIIRCVGKPEERYNEDALRIMRAFRFSSVLNFSIEKSTLSAALNLSYLLKDISVERIFMELNKLLMGQKPQNIEPLIKCGALDFVGISYCKSLNVLEKLPLNIELRFSAFLFLCNSDTSIVCKKLKTDNKLKNASIWYLSKLISTINTSDYELKKLMFEKDYEAVYNLLVLFEKLNNTDLTQEKERLGQLKDDPIYIKDLDVNGNDLKDLGILDNNISKVLIRLLDEVHKNPKMNNKCQLLKIAKDC